MPAALPQEVRLNETTRWRPALALGAVLSIVLAACSATPGGSASPTTQGSGSAASAGPMDLSQVPAAPSYSQPIAADGSTFVQPAMEQWTQDYATETGIQISYTGGGSGQGIKDLTANTVAFAGTDSPMKDDERKAAEDKYGPVLHLPVVFGGIVMAYNLDGVDNPINFTPDVIGKIFTGKITTWNDAAIKADNPDANLPDQKITVVHRSDGSGTTATFTGWLCSVSTDWKDKLGADKCAGKEVEWPVGLGGKGNPGVTSTVTSTPGSLGFIELAYAVQNKVPYGNVQSASGEFIEPTLDSVAAAANFDTIPDDLIFQAYGSAAKRAYPIAGVTWLLVYQQQDKAAQAEGQAQAVVHFLLWALDKGGDSAKSLDYAVLPDKLREATLAQITTITWNGTPVVNSLYK